MAYVIPIMGYRRGDRGPAVVVVVLTDENLERMSQGDPFDIQLHSLGPMVRGRRLEDLDLVIARESDAEFMPVLEKFQAEGDPRAVFAWIERGRKHRPQEGDATAPVRLDRNEEGGRK